MLRIVNYIVVWLWCLQAAYAQTWQVQSSAQSVKPGEVFTLSYTLDDFPTAVPLRERPKEVQVVDGPTVISGQHWHPITKTIVTYHTYRFQVYSKRKGTILIPKLSIVLPGKTIASSALSISVSDTPTILPNQLASWEEAKGRDAWEAQFILPKGQAIQKWINDNQFTRVEASTKQAFIGESVQLRYYLYSKLVASNAITQLPVATQASTEEIPILEKSRTDTVMYNGTEYRRTLLYALQVMPLTTGNVLVSPLRVRQTVSYMQEEKSVGLQAVIDKATPQQIVTNDLHLAIPAIKVIPLPQPLPHSFSGAIGQFYWEWETPKAITVGQLHQLRLILHGKGNLSLINFPNLPKVAHVEWLQGQQQSKRDSTSGTMVFEVACVINKAGNIQMPSIPWQYFDPTKKAYVEANIPSLSLIAKETADEVAVQQQATSVTLQQGGNTFVNQILWIGAAVLLLGLFIYGFQHYLSLRKELPIPVVSAIEQRKLFVPTSLLTVDTPQLFWDGCWEWMQQCCKYHQQAMSGLGWSKVCESEDWDELTQLYAACSFNRYLPQQEKTAMEEWQAMLAQYAIL